jgi:conjugation system TraG family ATPase
MVKDILEIFPVLDVEDEFVITKNGDISLGFELTLPTIYTLSANEYNHFMQLFKRGFDSLDINTMVHKQDWFYPEFVSLKDSAKFGTSWLDDEHSKMFVEKPAYKSSCYIFFTKCNLSVFSKTSFSSSLLSGSILGNKSKIDDEAKDAFKICVERFISTITENSDGRIKARKLTYEELAPGVSSDFSVPEKSFFLSPNGDGYLGEVNFEKDHFTIGSKKAKIFNVTNIESIPNDLSNTNIDKKFSSETSNFIVGFTNPLGLTLAVPHIYNQFFFKPDVLKVRNEVESDIRFKNSLLLYARENQLSIEDGSMFLEDIITEGFNPMYFSANVIYWADEYDELKRNTTYVHNKIGELGIRPYEVTSELPIVFYNSIPSNAGDIGRDQCILLVDEVGFCFLNLEGSSDLVKSAYGIQLVNRFGDLITVDLFNEAMPKPYIDNYNFFLVGPSGSGKSFFINYMVRTYIERGHHIVMVDVGHSYELLCGYLGGTYLTFTEENPISFNPFYIEVGKKPDTDKIGFLVSLLLLCWKGSQADNATETEINEVLTAVNMFFDFRNREYEVNNVNILPCFNSFYQYMASAYSEQLKARKVGEQMFSMINFLNTTRIYFKGGIYEKLLNSTKIDLIKEKFVVFELDSIRNDTKLFNIVALVIMDLFSYKMFNQSTIRKHLIIEEAWKAISTPRFASYTKYLFKTARKHNATVGVVTQELDDLRGNAIVQDSIISQSDIKIMLDQRRYEKRFGEVEALLGLNEKDKMLINSINRNIPKGDRFNEVCISWAGKYLNVYGVKVTPYEYWLFTTQKDEKNMVKYMVHEYRSKGLVMMDAIRYLGRLLDEKKNPKEVMQYVNLHHDYLNKIKQNPSIILNLVNV